MNLLSVIRYINHVCLRIFQIVVSNTKLLTYSFVYNQNGNQFVCKGKLINSSISVRGKNNRIIISGGVFVNMTIDIRGEGHQLILDKGVSFHEGGRIVMEDRNCSIRVGENTDFVSCFFAVRDSGTNVMIGKSCMFSALTIVRTSDAHSILNSEGKRINPGKDVYIGDHVWVGYGANILKNTDIGNNAIVGTQSVVAGISVPDGCVVAGNPARIVKNNINWCRQRI